MLNPLREVLSKGRLLFQSVKNPIVSQGRFFYLILRGIYRLIQFDQHHGLLRGRIHKLRPLALGFQVHSPV